MSLTFWFFSLLLLFFNLWTLYNIPVVVAGVRSLLWRRKEKKRSCVATQKRMPLVSIIVPVKDEEKVVARLLGALLNLDYPSDKKEIIVVNDASSDKTEEICNKYASSNAGIAVFSRPESTTKAAALNYGVRCSRGEIIATFDADSVPEPDALLKAVTYFEDVTVAAVQGRICSINADENMLTKFLSYEGGVQYEVYMAGKDELNLFVSLAGTCQFVRRSVLEEAGGWNESCLSEDTELSLRLAQRDHVIKYASDVRTWEESPFTIRSLISQRSRWYRGNIELMSRFGTLLKRPSMRRIDAEVTLFGTLVMILCVVNYFMAFWSFSMPPNFVMTMVVQFTSLFTLIILGVVGIALAYVAKPHSVRSVLWLPFIYVYWGFQSFIAVYALLQEILRRPRKWSKTARSGLVTTEHVKELSSECSL